MIVLLLFGLLAGAATAVTPCVLPVTPCVLPVLPALLSTLRARVVAKGVFLVLSSSGGRSRRVHVSLDGKLVGAAPAGTDVHGGAAVVRRQRLYQLVRLRGP